MTTFNFQIIKETENAVYAKVPYFETTSQGVKKHKQLYYECWIPKSVIEKGVAKHFVISKRNEKRLTNPYQKMCNMPQSWNTMGEYAPTKTPQIVNEIDYDKLSEMRTYYENKYGAKFRTLCIDEEGDNGFVSEEDMEIINSLAFATLDKIHVPKKQVTIYL